MNRILSLILLFVSSVGCSALVAQDYFPLQPGNKWYYEWVRAEIVLEVESKSYKYNGNTYWAIIDSTPDVAFDSSRIIFDGKPYNIYRSGRAGIPIGTMFYRKDVNENVYWYDEESDIESILIPGKIVEGQTWVSSDSTLEFKMISTHGTFKSKFSTFTNCLVIATKVLKTKDLGSLPEPNGIDSRYYCQGIGYVGSKSGDKLGMTLLRREVSKDR